MKTNLQIIISIISLLALLAYTLVHTGGLLARYIHPPFVGYVAALGIEAAVVSLSLRIGELRKSKQSTGFFFFVLLAVVIVSAVANIAEGFTAVQAEPLTLQSVKQLDPIQAFIGLAATGLVSLIVLALSEIIGTDVQMVVKQVERDRKRQASNTEEMNDKTPLVERARAAKAEKDLNDKQTAVEQLLAYVNDNPNASFSDIGRTIERSKATVSNYVKELEQNGRLHKNGDGYRVL